MACYNLIHTKEKKTQDKKKVKERDNETQQRAHNRKRDASFLE